MDNLCIRSFLQEMRYPSLLYWWSYKFFPNGITRTFLLFSSFSLEHLYMLWIEWFLNLLLLRFIFSLFFWCHYNNTTPHICQHIFIYFLQLLFILSFAELLYCIFFILYIIFWQFYHLTILYYLPHTSHSHLSPC